jgi:hypothetical protein
MQIRTARAKSSGCGLPAGGSDVPSRLDKFADACFESQNLGGGLTSMIATNHDLAHLTRDELIDEVIRLRAGIRAHRDSSGHDLCWHHPELWGLLPEPIPKNLAVPDWPEFLRGCIKYRQALDRELPDAPRTDAEVDEGSRST